MLSDCFGARIKNTLKKLNYIYYKTIWGTQNDNFAKLRPHLSQEIAFGQNLYFTKFSYLTLPHISNHYFVPDSPAKVQQPCTSHFTSLIIYVIV